MKKILTAEEMRKADEYTIQKLGVSSLILMERAGNAIAQVVTENLKTDEQVLVVCGGGNNGGDGFVTARILQNKGIDCEVLCLAKKFSPDCLAEKEKFQGEVFTNFNRKSYAVIVDCLFGTGLNRAVEGENKQCIDYINHSGALVISADISSGIQGSNGLVQEVAVKADITVAIESFKTGHFLNDGVDYCGKLVLKEIGITSEKEEGALLLTKEEVSMCLPLRKRNSHKGTYGKVTIMAGSYSYSGAALLSSQSALRGGAGYVELCVPQGMYSVYAGKIPSVILTAVQGEHTFTYCERELEKICKSECIVLGMGTTVTEDLYKIIKFLLNNFTGTLVLDADALNCIAKYGVEILKEKKCQVIITPHCKEFSRLTKKNIEDILKNPIACAQEFSKEYTVVVVLKNAVTIICQQEKVYLNTTGTSALAKGGSGDILSGLISSIASYLPALDSACLGCYLFGKAGELAEEEQGAFSVTSQEVIEKIGKSFLSITK